MKFTYKVTFHYAFPLGNWVHLIRKFDLQGNLVAQVLTTSHAAAMKYAKAGIQ